MNNKYSMLYLVKEITRQFPTLDVILIYTSYEIDVLDAGIKAFTDVHVNKRHNCRIFVCKFIWLNIQPKYCLKCI